MLITRTRAPPSWLTRLPQKFSAAMTSTTRDCAGVPAPLAAPQAVVSMVTATGPAAAASHRDARLRRVPGQRVTHGHRKAHMNRLSDATSPYLLQHAGNPVNWWPCSDEAFAEARARDVPVLLSVGYAACHWCHVMAHESFEDPETAELLNENLVAIKVDREERPDVDAVYMAATLAMTGQGGWPMTVFMTPDGEPFYCGTYFPRETFQRLVLGVAKAWRDDRDGVSGQAGRI